MSRVAFITGITGQDGSYLAEFLLEKGYHVWGLIRRASQINTQRIDHIFDRLSLRYGDLTDHSSLRDLFSEMVAKHSDAVQFEVYNLAAQSHVKVSFETPVYTSQVDAIGTLHILECVRSFVKEGVNMRMYQASTSEMFGASPPPQSEQTPFHPRSPYGVAKVFGYWMVRNYRESYNLFACNGILFNHTSPRRGHNFVCRKVTRAVGQLRRGEIDCLRVGNIYSTRDFGHARDFVQAMWLMLQQDKPMDLVVSSNETILIKDWIQKAFALGGYSLRWEGQGVDEKAYDAETGKLLVAIDPKYFRPAEVDSLLGDSAMAREVLGWQPEVDMDSLLKEMVEADLAL